MMLCSQHVDVLILLVDINLKSLKASNTSQAHPHCFHVQNVIRTHAWSLGERFMMGCAIRHQDGTNKDIIEHSQCHLPRIGHFKLFKSER